MSDALRRMFNAVDALFDARALSRDVRASRDLGASKLRTALQAFQIVQPVAQDFDRDARLKRIVSQHGIMVDGTSACWEFFFDLPQRRAQLLCQWVLSWDETTDAYGRARLETFVKPFPPDDSPIRQAVKEGKLLYRQMIGMWKQESKRRPDLATRFRDTELVLPDFMRQGLDITQEEFSVTTGQSRKGELCWIAQTKNAMYYSAFE